MGRTEGVGGVGGAGREGADEPVEGVRFTFDGQHLTECVPHHRGDRLRAPGGKGPAPHVRSLAQRVEHRVEQRPECAGSLGA
ncbi:hypothetical protein GCM10017771_17020 [Streptomyces capitiformicae]|uniref:Uncharacterized protein n=1 Tax=Streptomyces capitiformicae TaxID=2014920 RepID=A0A919L545_9ACTN|nr:hypothetical protein GCM10017771_17020 [Streptomyces capitiformicae]